MGNLSHAALLVIGMQQGSNDLRLGERNNPQAENNIHKLLHAWRATKRPIIHVQHVSLLPESLYSRGTPGVEFQPEFMPGKGEHVIEKNLPDAFANTGLDKLLRELHVRQIILTGNVTNNSIEATARNASHFGFAAIVPADASFTFDKADINGVRRSADEVHAMSLANLKDEYASITTTEALLRTVAG